METFFQQMINGLSLGSIYALIALGYTMVYGIIKLINFAHGDIYMVGAFIGYTMIHSFGMGFFPALLTAMALSALLGVLIERIAYKPLRHATRIAVLITAIGVSYLLQNGMLYFYGAEVRSFPQVVDNTLFEVAGLQVSRIQLLIFATTLVLMVLLQFIVQKTKMGKAMRAVSTDSSAAQLMGINVDNVISFTFFLGSALAGAAGVLVGLYYNTIDPMMGVAPGLKAFVAAVLGGIGFIPGAVLGGFTIGIVETLVSAYGNSMIRDAVVYGILILILIIRPAGILGKHVKEKV
ncbi:branched-chain amino acid ABC transporter permease [Desemzia sp. C1]|uniref:Amino acid/amide ABC transporter membrane protein 1, HAAT family n=1 Tax=Desemzia incerta TaxID=82801 RepID=A0A1I5V4H0_9LACT|nr:MULTISPECIES: branched-chain amino acid ABC transporter permease [Desemzia]MCI3027823.1 branched-chain amino acid ABC transporter permease [Desemzia sp. C1]SFQ02464.1 amino acid/amide ABC transporter membrane protein 1, HAAT family [Desemzia incerta]